MIKKNNNLLLYMTYLKPHLKRFLNYIEKI